jgi:SOS response regulatory protein OraA/RecX
MRVSRVIQTPEEIANDLKRAGVDKSGIEQAAEHLRQEQQAAQREYDAMLKGR